jgi:hypothetical protein
LVAYKAPKDQSVQLVHKARQVRLDLLDHKEVKDQQDHKVMLDNLVALVFRDRLASMVVLVHKVHQELAFRQMVCKECRSSSVAIMTMMLIGQTLRAAMFQVRQDLKEIQAQLVQLAHKETQVHKETQAM